MLNWINVKPLGTSILSVPRVRSSVNSPLHPRDPPGVIRPRDPPGVIHPA